MTETATAASQRPPLWRDVRVLRVIAQLAAIVGVVLIVLYIRGNLLSAVDAGRIPSVTDLSFLDQPTNFTPAYDEGFDARSPVSDMLIVGAKNTALSAMVGIAIATVLGTILGIFRLSSNWLVAKLSMLYVEFFRNIPPLLIIIFFGGAIFTSGPFPNLTPSSEPIQLSVPGSDSLWLILSKTRIGLPSLASDGNVGSFWVIAALGFLAAAAVWLWRTRVQINTGTPHRRVLWSSGLLLAVVAIAWLVLDEPYRWSFPQVSESGRKIEGGLQTNDGFVSLTIALGLYTASHIAEIIRGSILAVPKGQTEASEALALTPSQKYRHVVLPQALRIALPPTISQYLNLTKNTSLGLAVAYADLTLLTKSSIGNGRPAVQSLIVLMLFYLSFSLIISAVMNQVNKRLQLVGR